MRKNNLIKYFSIISISIIVGCGASDFVSNKQKLQGNWEMIIPRGSIYMGGNLYRYIFKEDSFYVTETFIGDVLPYIKDIDKGSGTYYLINNEIFFNGFYTESYRQKTEVEYYIEGETIIIGEVIKDTIYNYKQIKKVINEVHFYCFKGDTLILDSDKKYGKKYFVREQ
jgi:hypothetical protein